MGATGQQSESSSFTENASLSQAGSFNNSGSFIAQQQMPFLQSMWQQATQFANPGASQDAARGASGAIIPQLDRTMRDVGALVDPSAQIGAQTASLQSGLGSLFRNEINPAIQTDAIASGGFGGGRQGVAEGIATGQLADAFTRGYGDIVSRANQTAVNAGGLMPGLADARYRAQVMPQSAGMDVMAQLAQILGAPTVLNASQGGSSAVSSSYGVGSSQANDQRFGFSLV